MQHKIDVLHGHCETVDPAEIAITVIGGGDPMADPDQFLRQVEDYAGLGVSKIWVGAPQDSEDPVGWVEQVSEQILPTIDAV